MNVKEPPRAVSERDERLLAEKIEKITEEATDSDSDGETMGSVDICRPRVVFYLIRITKIDGLLITDFLV